MGTILRIAMCFQFMECSLISQLTIKTILPTNLTSISMNKYCTVHPVDIGMSIKELLELMIVELVLLNNILIMISIIYLFKLKVLLSLGLKLMSKSKAIHSILQIQGPTKNLHQTILKECKEMTYFHLEQESTIRISSILNLNFCFQISKIQLITSQRT